MTMINIDNDDYPHQNIIKNHRWVFYTGRGETALTTWMYENRAVRVDLQEGESVLVAMGSYKKTRATSSQSARYTSGKTYSNAFAAAWGPPPGQSHLMEAGVATRRHFLVVYISSESMFRGAKTRCAARAFQHQDNTRTYVLQGPRNLRLGQLSLLVREQLKPKASPLRSGARGGRKRGKRGYYLKRMFGGK